MVQHRLELRLHREMSECGIDCFAAHHAILVVLGATVRRGDKMLDTSFPNWDDLPAEKATMTLQKE